MLSVYLAGPIRGLTYGEAVDWRDKAEDDLIDMGYRSASPMRGKQYLEDYGPLNGSRNNDGAYPSFPMSSAQGLFRRDMFDVAQCDILLANFEHASQLSIGTCMEIQRAYDLGKYVLTVLEPGALHDHAFIQQASSLTVPCLEDAMHYLAIIGKPYRG